MIDGKTPSFGYSVLAQILTSTKHPGHQVVIDETDTNVTLLATDLDHTLVHLADLTGDLAWQAQVNTNLVSEISTTIVHTDDLIQGLKREWFLRTAFKKKAAKPAATAPAAKP